jgi:hypothetical protein
MVWVATELPTNVVRRDDTNNILRSN